MKNLPHDAEEPPALKGAIQDNTPLRLVKNLLTGLGLHDDDDDDDDDDADDDDDDGNDDDDGGVNDDEAKALKIGKRKGKR